jgi:uncharacterized membrane protein YbaN (DUF454 family)
VLDRLQAWAGRSTRLLYLLLGLACVGLGGLGTVVPGLPTTVFFIIAAWAFSKSSRRLENWVLNLPGIGQMVRDNRAGLGMPRKAKILACSCIVLAVGASAGFLIGPTWVRLLVVAVGLVGVAYIVWRVPTRETVLAQRAAAEGPIDGSATALSAGPG